ncbi:hypothetical protein GCM10011608_57810 [Micromonospora sonchi]|uniref:Uncharacterized protein n=1 Tax=Micromonospora sonchi TaxID=1763543 RepID=A0A917U896_9ACTN|nr:hypothetical protein GCM10011608_57810 [Micromonospora sonchi]
MLPPITTALPNIGDGWAGYRTAFSAAKTRAGARDIMLSKGVRGGVAPASACCGTGQRQAGGTGWSA